ncbi:hypothetical protein [Stetteria hydrogenophila]
MSGDSVEACSPSKDFLRHIANPIISRYSGKLPLPVMDEVKKRLARAEDKYRFSIYNGDPSRIASYLDSEDFLDLAKYLKAVNNEWILEEILKALAEEYAEECPKVAEKAREAAGKLKEGRLEREQSTITVDGIARMLKMAGYSVERTEDGKLVIKEPFVTVTIWQSGDSLNYQICRRGKVTTFDALLAKISKIREA